MSLREDMEKVQEKIEVLQEESFAMSILSDYKKQNQRQFIIILVILALWFVTGFYLVYILNDTGVIEESTQEINDVNTIENSNIANGDMYGQDKTN